MLILAVSVQGEKVLLRNLLFSSLYLLMVFLDAKLMSVQP